MPDFPHMNHLALVAMSFLAGGASGIGLLLYICGAELKPPPPIDPSMPQTDEHRG